MSYTPPTIAEMGLEYYLTAMGFDYKLLVLMHDANNTSVSIARTLGAERAKAGRAKPGDLPPHPNTVRHWRRVLVKERSA